MNSYQHRAVIEFGHVRLLSDQGKFVAAPSGGGGGSQGAGKGQGGGVGTGKGQGAVHGRGEGVSAAVSGLGRLVSTLAVVSGGAPPPQAGGGAVVSGYRTAVLADSPLVYWKLDETAGTVAKDSSGGGWDGTYVNGPTLGQTPLIATGKSAVLASASSQYVHYTNPSGITNVGAVRTAEIWIKTTQSFGGFPAIFGADNPLATHQWFMMRGNSGNHIEACWSDTGGNLFVQDGSIVVNDGVTHHVVMTQDGTKSHIYVDGVEDGTGVAYSTAPQTGAVIDFAVGIRFNTGDPKFNGTVDEVAIYSTALSAARVAAHYAARTN